GVTRMPSASVTRATFKPPSIPRLLHTSSVADCARHIMLTVYVKLMRRAPAVTGRHLGCGVQCRQWDGDWGDYRALPLWSFWHKWST
ncbi:hypothetical protein NDU88_003958, partial [Pleurodeles waltl]